MSMSKAEQMLAEAIKNALDDDALGLVNREDTKDEDSHTFTFMHEEVEQQFRLEIMDLVHHDAIAAAFNRIHSYKYLDNPSFNLSFKKDLTAQGVPMEECDKAIDAIAKVQKKLIGDNNEAASGWNPQLDEIIKVSQPAQFDESIERPKDKMDQEREFFTDSKVRDWLNADRKLNFWENVRQRIKPMLEGMGYEIANATDFWKAYDDPKSDPQIRNRMHELYENTHSLWQSRG